MSICVSDRADDSARVLRLAEVSVKSVVSLVGGGTRAAPVGLAIFLFDLGVMPGGLSSFGRFERGLKGAAPRLALIAAEALEQSVLLSVFWCAWSIGSVVFRSQDRAI